MDDSPLFDFIWRRPYWEKIGNRYLQEVEISSWPEGLLLKGRAGSLAVSIASRMGKTQVVITVPGPPDFIEVSIRREGRTPWKTQEIEIGSESFDKTFFIGGPARLVFALLDAETRDLLIHANREIPKRLEIASGEIVAEITNRQISRLLPLLFKMGERLAQPMDIGQRLIRNATQDPEAGVRLKNLLVLARELPVDPETRKVLQAACSDRSSEVRLRASMALGAEGIPVLLKLAEGLEDDVICAEAVSALNRELSFDRAQGILQDALVRHFRQTARVCMFALRREGDAAIGVLAKVLEQEDEQLAVFAADVLEKIKSPKAEGPLILALQSDRPALRIAAANALAQVGTPAAVLPLKEAAEQVRNYPHIDQAIRQAIAAIQLRLPGASPGQLSLAGAEAGQLSLTEPGQLSFAEDRGGQLSLGDDGDQSEKA